MNMKGFDKCIADGGEVSTVQIPGDKYQRLCKILGKVYKSPVKKKKKK